MREVISINGKLPSTRYTTQHTAPEYQSAWPVNYDMENILICDLYSRPGWLPNCQLLLGGEWFPGDFEIALFSWRGMKSTQGYWTA
jgi:hypothetical protein